MGILRFRDAESAAGFWGRLIGPEPGRRYDLLDCTTIEILHDDLAKIGRIALVVAPAVLVAIVVLLNMPRTARVTTYRRDR
jgi:hypothetical protein